MSTINSSTNANAATAAIDAVDGVLRDEESNSRYHLQDEDGDARRLASPGRRAGNDGNRQDASGTASDGNYGGDDKEGMSLTELLYSSSSYYAIVKPVTLTMILSALAVMYVNDDSTRMQAESEMTETFSVWQAGASSNAGYRIGMSLANAFVLVGVICLVTFFVVFLYRFRCMWFLMGYMVFASATLLGILGGTMLEVWIQVYDVTVDKLSFYWFLYNFAVVGVMAVFWGKGIPKFVSKGYLVATSVILAWQLTSFDEVTTWCLLILLALYDLCAVLTPCGPLRALVNLMSREDSPEMPGLLYEAELPPEARRPGGPPRGRGNQQSKLLSTNQQQQQQQGNHNGSGNRTAPAIRSDLLPSTVAPGADTDAVADDRSNPPEDDMSETSTNMSSLSGVGPNVKIPLAIAMVYNLPIVESAGLATINESNTNGAPLLAGDIPGDPTPKQLNTEVTVQLPATGGRIERTERARMFLERDRFGNPKRTLWVDRKGKVFSEEVDDDGKDGGDNSIRLGLGDFIFYSVLVAKAAQHGFSTFVACVLVILTGLGGTLVLLAVYHHALPALPFSIFLGVAVYFLTRQFVEPWIEMVLSQPYYV